MKKAVLFSLIFFSIFAGLVIVGGYFTPDIKLKIAAVNNNKNSAIENGQNEPIETLTIETVAGHNSASDCWMIIEGKVYDFTEYFTLHPGGAEAVLEYCGADGSEAYRTKDYADPKNHSEYANSLLQNYFLGNLNEALAVGSPQNIENSGEQEPISNEPQPLPSGSGQASLPGAERLTSAEISKHNNPADCWMIYSGKVYNITSYFGQHPGGDGALSSYCGKDGTVAFNSEGHSSYALSLLGNYYIGDFNSTAVVTENPNQAQGGGSAAAGSGSIEEQYPGAVVIEENIEDDGRQEIKFIYENKKYKADLDSGGSIIKVEIDDDDDN